MLLNLLLQAGEGVSKIKLMKWLFLLRNETDIDIEKSFYDFLPYHYGPFSFTVYRDLSELKRDGLVDYDDRNVWLKNEDVAKSFSNLSKKYTTSISSIIKNFGDMSQKKLISYVYKQYPWYASRSKLLKTNLPTPDTKPRIFHTLGYEGMSIDNFLNNIMLYQIENVIDIRSNPNSRKYGFSKKALTRLCDKLGINYYHFSNLGIPSTYRQGVDSFSDDDYEQLWNLYENKILKNEQDSINELCDIVRNKSSILFCFENAHETCHRNKLSKIISKQIEKEVFHLNINLSVYAKRS